MTAKEVLDSYIRDDLPCFFGLPLIDVNQRGHDGDCPLHVACIRGNLEQALALLAGGAFVNAIGDMEYLPIHYAITKRESKLVELLVNAGADLNAKNEFGESARSLAQKSDNPEIRKLIENAS